MTFTAAWAIFRRVLPFILFALAVGVVLWLAFRFGVRVEHAKRVAEVAELKLVHTTTLHTIDSANKKALQDATDRARKAEQDGRDAVAAIDLKYTKELSDARKKSIRDVAAARSGALQLRDRFTCPGASSTPSGLSTTVASSSVDTGTATGGLRPDDAAVLVQESDRADAVVLQLTACQAILLKDRQP